MNIPQSTKSPTRSPNRKILDAYVGPIPYKVVPIAPSPLRCSATASAALWISETRVALKQN